MTNSIPDETLNPNTTQQCQQQQSLQPQQSQSQSQSQSPHSDPKSPQTQTLTLPDPPSPNPNQHQYSFMPDPITTLTVDDAETDVPSPAAYGGGGGLTRRTSKRKKHGPKRPAQERKFREKLQNLVRTLKPIPFTPEKTLDFEKHQSLLQRLGLWDFVHLEFDSPLRGDLVAQLIASYVPGNRCGYVNGVRINVNRADLGRALKLPKKTVGAALGAADSIELRESAGFVEELVYNWMILHYDAYIVPNDVLACMSLIREGDFEKVDWAGLVWSMVEKELKAPLLESCYYASHLQHLIKVQREELLQEGVEVVEEENEVKEEEEENEVVEEEEEENEVVRDEVDAGGDVQMGEVDEGQVNEIEEHNIELSLGQDNNVERVEVEKEQSVEEQMMDVALEQSKEEEEPAMWLLDEKNCAGEPFLRPCHGGDVKDVDCEQVREDEVEDVQEQEEEEDEEEEDGEEEEHEGGFHLSPKCIPMEGMTSGNGSLIQVMDGGQMPFASGIDLRDNSMGDFLSSRDEPQMIPGSSLFGNGHKRDSMGLDNHNSHHSLNGSNKGLRSDSPWNSKPMDFESCMEQMEHWMGKARMMYATKDQACEESTMNQQLLINELDKRDGIITHLHKAKMEEAQKREMEVYRFEKELYMMQSLVDGYRKALKETQKAFAEYRARCPQGEEPLYKDVPGSGGLVLTVMELERERQKKEAEEKAKLRELMIDFEKKYTDLESTWRAKFEGYMSIVESMNKRLLDKKDQIKHLYEVKAKRKVSDPIECAPTSEGEIGDHIECAPTSEGEIGDRIECAPATEGEIADSIECAPTAEGETA